MYSTQRGDIYYADLNPVKGLEQGGDIRPVLIIQNDIGNQFSPTLVIAAITNRKKSNLPTHVTVKGKNCLKENSIILLEQIRTIDRIRLREYIGCLDSYYMRKVDRALAVSIGLNKKFCENGGYKYA